MNQKAWGESTEVAADYVENRNTHIDTHTSSLITETSMTRRQVGK